MHALLLDEAELNKFLDDDMVCARLLESPAHVPVSPQLYFYVIVRHVMREAGVEDRAVADYLASLLVSYLPSGRNSRHLPYVVDEMSAIAATNGADRFFLVVELADRLMFMTGLYRRHIEHRCECRGAPPLDYYENVGGSHYRAAGGHSLAREFCLREIFQALGEAFHDVRIALNRIGERMAFTGEDEPGADRYLLN